MSVIPLITDGDGKTVVQKQEQFNVEGNAVLIAELDEAQLKNGNDSNVSYDFRIGNRYRSHLEDTPVEIPDAGTIMLRPRSALIIETKEYVHLPRGMFGIIAPKVSLLQLGLSTTFSKVDPGYNGPLLITLFNLGQSTQVLRKGQTFCGFSLMEVNARARLYGGGAKQLHGRIRQPFSERVREWLEANHVLVMILLILATVLLIGATVLLTIAHLVTLFYRAGNA